MYLHADLADLLCLVRLRVTISLNPFRALKPAQQETRWKANRGRKNLEQALFIDTF